MFKIQPDNTVFAILSFEGPDIYSLAGGLGVRVTELGKCLSDMGFDTHLFFAGDPNKPFVEKFGNDKFTLHRWCQQLSANAPTGVYENERYKVYDYERFLPQHLFDEIIKPATLSNKKVVILGEEWHTAPAIINIHKIIKHNSLEKEVTTFWNANNTYFLERINWRELCDAAVITTISRYMKHIMSSMGLSPLIIPNGIPSRALKKVDFFKSGKLRHIFKDKMLLVKVGRYDPNKRWIMAIEALSEIKKRGKNAVLLMRGGKELHRYDILKKAESLNLKVRTLEIEKPTFENMCLAFSESLSFDILELNFFLPEEILRLFYHCADAVLANSGHEPFGLVGLEVMATEGIALTGATGEDYAESFENSIVIETGNPKEITVYLLDLLNDPKMKDKIHKNAYKTAQMYTWENVADKLFKKIEFVMTSGIKG